MRLLLLNIVLETWLQGKSICLIAESGNAQLLGQVVPGVYQTNNCLFDDDLVN